MQSRRTVLRKLALVIAMGLGAGSLAACGWLLGDDGRLEAPNYASPLGSDRWEVNCGHSRISVDDDDLEEFYKDDGAAMTYSEFCREAEPTRTRRDRRR